MNTQEIIALALDDNGRDLTIREARALGSWLRGVLLCGVEESPATDRDVADALDYMGLACRALDRAADAAAAKGDA